MEFTDIEQIKAEYVKFINGLSLKYNDVKYQIVDKPETHALFIKCLDMVHNAPCSSNIKEHPAYAKMDCDNMTMLEIIKKGQKNKYVNMAKDITSDMFEDVGFAEGFARMCRNTKELIIDEYLKKMFELTNEIASSSILVFADHEKIVRLGL